jgi:hypothetical protein
MTLGQFTRKSIQQISKLFWLMPCGNTNDLVEYFDADPWPTSLMRAPTFDLVNTALDNNIASKLACQN